MIRSERWGRLFNDFSFPYGFYGVDEYKIWLHEAGLRPLRVELIPKDMTHDGAEGLARWIGSTWLPYVERVPEERREEFVADFVARYLEEHPAYNRGRVYVRMVRLEVEATNQ
ncbi:MAG TPA: hypothetical protein VGX92_10705 [Pyrinomonadaceae bacterium]|nr:hypothetical protein [Pyrinomonadaceae bacterium]